jgi:hypothetical protein
MVAKEVFVFCYNFNPITKSQKRLFSRYRYLVKLSGAGVGAGAAIRISGGSGI